MQAPHLTYGLDEYAEVEAGSELRFEPLDGQLVAMAGGTLEHADLIAEVAAVFRASLAETPCRVTRAAAGWTAREVHGGEIVLRDGRIRFDMDRVYEAALGR